MYKSVDRQKNGYMENTRIAVLMECGKERCGFAKTKAQTGYQNEKGERSVRQTCSAASFKNKQAFAFFYT